MPLWPYILKVFVIIYFGFHLVSVRMPEPYYLYFVNVMELWNLLLLPPSFPQNLLHSAGLICCLASRQRSLSSMFVFQCLIITDLFCLDGKACSLLKAGAGGSRDQPRERLPLLQVRRLLPSPLLPLQREEAVLQPTSPSRCCLSQRAVKETLPQTPPLQTTQQVQWVWRQ